MTLTLTNAWYEQVCRVGADVRILVRIEDGSHTWNAVSGSMDSTSSLYKTPVGIAQVSAIGAELDPLTRRLTTQEVIVDFLDAFLRPILVNYRIRSKKCSIFIGAAGIDESDFAEVYAGPIEEINPVDGGIVKVSVLGPFGVLQAADIVGYWIGKHPLEILYKGDGTGILEKSGIPATMIDTAAFDPSIYTGTSHVILSRVDSHRPGAYASYDSWKGHGVVQGPSITADWGCVMNPTNAMALVESICELMHGQLTTDEEGKLTFGLFDSSAAAVANWTMDDILPGTFKQDALDANIINQIVWKFGRKPYTGGSEYGETYRVDETASQSAYAYPGTTERILSREFKTNWIDSVFQIDGSEITSVATSLSLRGPTLHGLSGNRTDAWASISATRPLWLLIDSSYSAGVGPASSEPPSVEIVKTETAITRDANVQGELAVYDPETETWSATNGWVAKVDLTNVSRGQLGTTATKHYGRIAANYVPAWVYDITPLVLTGDALLGRFRYGCDILEFDTYLHTYEVQVGNLVTVTCPLYLSYGRDGLTTSYKFEVISKELDLFADPPRIRWRLAYAATESPTRAATCPKAQHTDFGNLYKTMTDDTVTNKFVAEGLTITKVAGFVATIAPGHVTNGAMSTTFFTTTSHTYPASKDTYVYANLATDGIEYTATALGFGSPSAARIEAFIGKVTTDAVEIVSIDQTGQETLAVNGDKLKSGSGPLTHLAQSSGVLDNITSVTLRSLDDVTDGATYLRVTGVSAGHQAQAASIASNAVEEAKINALAVTEGKIGALAVTSGKIGANAVIAGKIATGGVSVGTQVAANIIGPYHLPTDAMEGLKNNEFASWTRGSAYPPDRWSVSAGVWDTDINRNTSDRRSGNYAVEFVSTLTTPALLAYEYQAVIGGNTYEARAWMTAGSVAGGKTCYVGVNWYTIAKVFISTSIAFEDELDVISTYQRCSGLVAAPANAGFGRLRIGRTAASFSAVCDMAELVEAVAQYRLQDGAVVEAKVGALAITSGKIGSNAVIAGKIATGGVSVATQVAANTLGWHQLISDNADRPINGQFGMWSRG